eukprot:CAMPEP_0194233428 /NCGR_PEP_ID=MMETSP0158-20130606/1417_1 /TAXON_ID=33649 /ORGANISM="Thalassionema nitzschioides, Strain L26-B" /LENGTH=402 /DNA_ID=CAMNT_0038966337 /DNA_START=28 /DNA_END=1233 /DNA_ORIENTATION=+
MATLLTADTVTTYVLKNLDKLPTGFFGEEALTSLTASAIQGGNVNYAFVVSSGDKKVFVKQAPEFVAIFGPDGFPLTSERMQKEMNVYKEWKDMLKDDQGYLPEIYFFDKSHMAVCMQFLDGYELLDHVLVSPPKSSSEWSLPASISEGLGTFMGQTHAATHSSRLSEEKVAFYTKEYENRPMRDIQLEFVFTKAYKESTEEERCGLEFSGAFMGEVEELKTLYNNTTSHKDNSLVLSHGDLHPGSVMVDEEGDMKVIDPEFTIYGPPGLDVGSLLSGYVLGAIHQAFSKHGAAAEKIIASIKLVWDSYVKAFTAEHPDASTSLIESIEVETVGFAVAEVCRTALGKAGGRLWLQFPDDPTTQKSAMAAALKLVQSCMVARNNPGAMSLLETELKIACNAEQ